VTTTILMLSVDEAGWLERSLPASAGEPDARVVLVDNACTDASAEIAARHGAEVIALESRVSYAAAINRGLRATADGADDAVLLLNADCVIRAGFVAAARARLFASERTGSVAPKLLRAGDGAGGEIDAAAMVIDRRRKNTLVGHGEPAARFAASGPAFGADGAAALYRRETLRDCAEAGGAVLDEDLALWASDVDLAWRAQLLGWGCVYEPAAVAVHQRTYSPSTRADMAPEAKALQFRNRYLMTLKNDAAAQFTRDLPRIALYELLALGHALLRERFLLGAYRDAWRLRGVMRERRNALQARRRVARVPLGLIPPSG
jgi:GT2 family glycosyltransferase